ncbi:hypothetical protein JI750_11450 [Flavobacterium sp. GN10]|uniref:Uncharacterized protein n=1 Tax=Flavobacterium tagetis TaxID=2801336 RepID=A0ABS1KDD4_9FLAO|nr:hypothetical protein [Flavobacterium tagetis]MBL0737508.1 hypothetical protein [Flavobacterium tagetis]
MNTIDKNNSPNKDFKNHFSNDRNLAEDLNDDVKKPDNDNREIAERGYTVRNGYNPNRPNPDQEDFVNDDDLDDLNDDFHNDRDLEDDNDDIYEVELEDENDEFDNPSDLKEDEFDFNETEDVLEDIDDEDEDEYDDDDDDFIEEDIDDNENDYIEDDVQEDNDDEEYPENDPRKF